MTDAQAEAVMEFATLFAGLKKDGRLRKCLIMHGGGYSPAAIAAHLTKTDYRTKDVTPAMVRAYLARGWRRLAAHRWTEFEVGQLNDVAERIINPAVREHTSCAMILDAARGVHRFRDQSPEYDERGREVASRGPLVSVDDLVAWLKCKSGGAYLDQVRVDRGEVQRELAAIGR